MLARPKVIVKGNETLLSSDTPTPPAGQTKTMSETTCPQCNHRFISHTEGEIRPDPTVVRWLREAVTWSGEMSTGEVYTDYLNSCGEAPVSRRRFVADLGYLGIHEVLDDDTYMLIRE